MKKLLFLTMSLALMAFTGWAQKTVTGTVLDDKGLPLPGATVVEQGSSNGVSTDFDGNFSIDVADGASLEISYVGYSTTTVAVGDQDSISVTLSSDNELEEVIVTALGIKREARSLGYSVKRVGSEEIEQKGQADVARTLQGKVAGVNITNTTATSGSGTNIVIRGMTSITGSNQPLIYCRWCSF